MTRKSAASVKAVKKSVAEERTPEEYFEEAKAGLDVIASAYIKNCMRIDNVFDMFLSLKSLDCCEINFIDAIVLSKGKRNIYETIKERINNFEYDDFTKEDMDDPFIDMLEYVDEKQPDHVRDAMFKLVKFNAVRPFGEKVEEMHMKILDKIEQYK